MNVNTYMFGNFGRGYEQYPQDQTRDVMVTFSNMLKKDVQFFIHRKGDIMYYVILQSLPTSFFKRRSQRRYFGLGIIANGVAISNLPQLITAMKNAQENAPISGKLLTYDAKGKTIPASNYIYDEEEEILHILNELKRQVAVLEDSIIPLPKQSFATSVESTVHCTDEDDMKYILKQSMSNGYTIVDLLAAEHENERLEKVFQSLLNYKDSETTDTKEK